MAPVDVQRALHAGDEEGLRKIFAAYGFRDQIGHPLLLCVAFEMLIAEYCRLKMEAQSNVEVQEEVGDRIIKGVAYEPVSGGSLDRIDELAKEINILALDHGYTVNITVNTLVEWPRDIFGSLIPREGCHILPRPLGFTSLKPSE